MSTCDPYVPNNQLLALLPPELAHVLQPRIDAVDLAMGEMLNEAGTVLSHVYFPVTAVVSLVSNLQDGACAEVAMVQRPGLAWRMSARDIADLARDCDPVLQELLRYTQALFTHMAQTSACNRHHAYAPQLCRWLLQHLDRQAGDDIRITQERIAGMLGARSSRFFTHRA